ncbi:hypothetical protein NQ317_004667 [Molorchus minor]|uniref:Uncharacterized protein n=1 Tax=Molorchus minor TaxID=1323400 RepID=A0ABQ9J3J3_9CUCU|nr:hypothetical protein NQ317_004667 [Molorchus minor]
MIAWQEGNAEKLPFEDNSFNAYTIAFGIRNCTHIDKVLEEAYRVLQPGGRFIALNLVMWKILKLNGYMISTVFKTTDFGQWKPYQYLVESIRQFPNQENFKLMIEEAGFRQVISRISL